MTPDLRFSPVKSNFVGPMPPFHPIKVRKSIFGR